MLLQSSDKNFITSMMIENIEILNQLILILVKEWNLHDRS